MRFIALYSNGHTKTLGPYPTEKAAVHDAVALRKNTGARVRIVSEKCNCGTPKKNSRRNSTLKPGDVVYTPTDSQFGRRQATVLRVRSGRLGVLATVRLHDGGEAVFGAEHLAPASSRRQNGITAPMSAGGLAKLRPQALAAARRVRSARGSDGRLLVHQHTADAWEQALEGIIQAGHNMAHGYAPDGTVRNITTARNLWMREQAQERNPDTSTLLWYGSGKLYGWRIYRETSGKVIFGFFGTRAPRGSKVRTWHGYTSDEGIRVPKAVMREYAKHAGSSRQNPVTSYRGVRLKQKAGRVRFALPSTGAQMTIGQRAGGLATAKHLIDEDLAAGRSRRRNPVPRAGGHKVKSVPITRIRDLTAHNHHTEAVVLLARALGSKSMLQKALAIQRIHERHGYLPHDAYDRRYKLLRALLAQAKRRTDAKTYQALYAAF